QHRRLRMQLFQVLHDGERFREMAAVVELEHGQAAERVLLQELRAAVLAGENVDGLGRDVESLLRHVDAQLPRIRRTGEVVRLHALIPPSARGWTPPTPRASRGKRSAP